MHKFYKSKQWRHLKEKIRRRSGGLCEFCWRRPMKQVHHRTYRHFGGGERVGDLMAVCMNCHRIIHNNQRSKIKRRIYFPLQGSPAWFGDDDGFTDDHQSPGHWRYFTKRELMTAYSQYRKRLKRRKQQ